MSSSNLINKVRTPARFAPGDVVRKRYEVFELLGAGANGAVYRVNDRYTETEVALKVLSPEHSVEAARRELAAARAVSHVNIAKVIDIDRLSTEPRCWLITQEFIEGDSLDAYGPDGERRLDPIDAIDSVDQLLAALEAIHPDFDRINELEQRQSRHGDLEVAEFYELQDLKASGFVHRDVKPQNIRRRNDGVIKLIDFGIASEVNSTIHTRSATPEYAPADADLFRWKPSYDLFAAGVIAFESLTGDSPFVDRTSALGRAANDSTQRLSESSHVLAVIERAISENPTQRFAAASAMRRALEEAAAADAAAPPRIEVSSGSTTSEAAQVAGMSAQYERALKIADRHNLGARQFQRSLMLTPGQNRSRYLVNLAFHPDRCGVGVSPENWSAFYNISGNEALAALHTAAASDLSKPDLDVLLTRLDQLLADLEPVESPIPSPVAELVRYLECHPDEFSVRALAEATGLPPGTTRRRLSDLANGRCAEDLRGRVIAVRRGYYAATR